MAISNHGMYWPKTTTLTKGEHETPFGKFSIDRDWAFYCHAPPKHSSFAIINPKPCLSAWTSLSPLNHLGLLVALNLTDCIRALSSTRRVPWRSSLRYEGLAHQSILRTESSQPAFKERLGGFIMARQRLADSSLLSKARRAEKRHRFLHMLWTSAFLGGLPSTLQHL